MNRKWLRLKVLKWEETLRKVSHGVPPINGQGKMTWNLCICKSKQCQRDSSRDGEEGEAGVRARGWVSDGIGGGSRGVAIARGIRPRVSRTKTHEVVTSIPADAKDSYTLWDLWIDVRVSLAAGPASTETEDRHISLLH